MEGDTFRYGRLRLGVQQRRRVEGAVGDAYQASRMVCSKDGGSATSRPLRMRNEDGIVGDAYQASRMVYSNDGSPYKRGSKES